MMMRMNKHKINRTALIYILLIFQLVSQIIPAYGAHIAEGFTEDSIEDSAEDSVEDSAEDSAEDFIKDTINEWIAVEAGNVSSYAIRSDNTLWAWGWNEHGQLGDGSNIDKYNPVQIMDDVAAVSAYRQPVVIKTDGSLWAWGINSYGQLGDGTEITRWSPVKIIEDVAAASTNGSSTMAIKTDGSLWAWGLNGAGTLGDGTNTHRSSPVKIMEDAAAVSIGSLFAMAIKKDCSLWAWGMQNYGELGDGSSSSSQLTPIKIMEDVVAVSAGGDHSLAVKTDGSLWAWGRNNVGQLGDGTTIDRYDPIKVMDDVTAVSAGWNHSMAIKKDGSLWAWGSNKWGELGDETQEEWVISTPMMIRNNVAAVSAGDGYTIAILTNGSMWSWGGNNSGRLGDGTDVSRRTPVMVVASDMLPGGMPTLPPPRPSSWAALEITEAIAAGLIPQELQTNYQIDITRGAVAQIIINLIEKVSGQAIDAFMTAKGVSLNTNAFIDTNDYAVLAANALDILQGVGENRFDPDGILTRAQVAVIINRIARVLGIDTDGYAHNFIDINDAWVDAELGWPVHAGILQGVGDDLFDPSGNLTVEMAIVIASRSLLQIKKYLHAPLLHGKTADTLFSILDGRFSIMMPDGTVDEALYYGGIMGTVSDSKTETYLSLATEGQTFFVQAQELFMYSTGDLTRDIAILLIDGLGSTEEGYIISEIVNVSDIQFITISPREINTSDSILLKGALINMSDNTLVYLGIYADAGAFVYKEDCIMMAEYVINTIQGGDRLLDTDNKTIEIFSGLKTERNYIFEIDRDYIYVHEKGIDFDVFYFYKLVAIDDEQPTFGIYIGGNPSHFGSLFENHTQINDLLMGQNIIWDVYSSEAGVIDNDTFAETLIDYVEQFGQYELHIYTHIFVMPHSQSDWNAIMSMLRAIKIKT